MDEADDVIGVADNPANRYFDPLTSPTPPRTSTDAAPNPDPVPPPPPHEDPAPPRREPTPPPAPHPRQPTPPPPHHPPSAYLYGHDNGLFAERLEDSDETFVQWAARESHADRPVRYPTELKKSTLPGHMVRAARFVKDGLYEDKRSVVRARVRRITALMDALFGANVLVILLAVVGMGMGLWLRGQEWDTYAQLTRWTVAGFALALLLAPGVAVPTFAKITALEHIYFLKVTMALYGLFVIPALGTGVSALPVDRGVGAEAYATRGVLLAYISAGGFISAVLAMACIAASTLIILEDEKWGATVSRGKLGFSGWKSSIIRDANENEADTRVRPPRWGMV